MASTFAPAAARPAAIPIRELLPWVIFAGLICLLGVYFVGAEEARLRSSGACTCMNSYTTAAICLASPATKQSTGSDSDGPRERRKS